MTFEELKAKAEGIFGRSLSDKEVAEVAINHLSECEEDLSESEEEAVRLKQDIVQLREELSEQTVYAGVVKAIADKVQNIISTKAKGYMIYIRLDRDRAPSVDYTVTGEPLVNEEEDYDEF